MKPRKPTKSRPGPRAASSRGKPDRPDRAIVLDFIQSQIESFDLEHGGGVSVRKDAHGYTLSRLDNGMPLARLRPRESGDRFEVLYWSPFSERWRSIGPFGGMFLSLADALEFIANDPMDCFWR
jgi:hypothetical protein